MDVAGEAWVGADHNYAHTRGGRLCEAQLRWPPKGPGFAHGDTASAGHSLGLCLVSPNFPSHRNIKYSK